MLNATESDMYHAQNVKMIKILLATSDGFKAITIVMFAAFRFLREVESPYSIEMNMQRNI